MTLTLSRTTNFPQAEVYKNHRSSWLIDWCSKTFISIESVALEKEETQEAFIVNSVDVAGT